MEVFTFLLKFESFFFTKNYHENNTFIYLKIKLNSCLLKNDNLKCE